MRAAPWFALSGAVCLLAAPPALAAPCAGFTDVDDSSGFCTSIAWVKNRGITLGCTTTSSYCPTAFVTREQMAAFLYRLGFNNGLLQGGNAFATTAVLGTTDNQALDIRVNGIRVMRYEPNATSPNIVGGHPNNFASPVHKGQTVSGGGSAGTACYEPSTQSTTRACANRSHKDYGTVAGGLANVANGTSSAVVGGESNTAGGYSSTVAGGQGNEARGISSAVLGGDGNTASGDASAVLGGHGNTASGDVSAVLGGYDNTASADYATVAGGDSNIASGLWSTVAGGANNTASGAHSFAAGTRAKATTMGSFIWADSLQLDFQPSVPNFFGVRATGGVGFTVKVFPDGVPEQFCNYLPNTAGWVCTSDREAKENLVPVDAAAVLDRLTTMPLFYWNFKGAGATFRNLGPTAQDFQAAFGISRDDKTIASGHVEGVALAAIQGLNVKLEQREAALRAEVHAKDAEMAKLRSESAELKRELAELRTAQHRELSELRLAIEVLMAQTSAEGRVAQSR